jgi:hypothetical protein
MHVAPSLVSLDTSDSSNPQAYSNNATSITKHNFGLPVQLELGEGTSKLTSAEINPLPCN